MIYLPRRAGTPWVEAFATAMSRGVILTVDLPVEEDPYRPYTGAIYCPGRLVRVTAGPYTTADGATDWRVLDPQANPLFVGGDAWDVAAFLVRAAQAGLEPGACVSQAQIDADDSAYWRERHEAMHRRCELWLLAYRTAPADTRKARR